MQRICWLCIVVQFMVVNEWNIVLNHWLAQGVHQYIYTIRSIPCHVHIHSFNNVVRLPNSNMGRLKETPFCEVLFHRWSSFRLLYCRVFSSGDLESLCATPIVWMSGSLCYLSYIVIADPCLFVAKKYKPLI